MLDNEIIKSIWKYFGPLLHLSCMPRTESPASQHKGLLLRPFRDWHFQTSLFCLLLCFVPSISSSPSQRGNLGAKIVSRNILPLQIIAFLDVVHEKICLPSLLILSNKVHIEVTTHRKCWYTFKKYYYIFIFNIFSLKIECPKDSNIIWISWVRFIPLGKDG